MKKTYVKPVVTEEEGVMEGVYMASGCYTTTARIHQRPQTGRGDYRIPMISRHYIYHLICRQNMFQVAED